MAQKQLSPVLQTRKINSLPKDLRKIADELLIKKFGSDNTVEKVVERQNSAYFREYVPELEQLNAGFSSLSDITYVVNIGGFQSGRPRINTRVDSYNRRCIVSTPFERISTRGIRDAIHVFDMENLPRTNRVIRLSPGFWNELKRGADLGYYMGYRENARDAIRGSYTEDPRAYVGEMFGCCIMVQPDYGNELEVSF